MPKFIYTAKSYSGETKGGEMIAQDEKTLAQQLRSEGYLVTSIAAIAEEKDDKNKTNFLNSLLQSVPLKDKMVFARNLSVMIASGLTVSRAISNLALQATNKTFQKILNDVYEKMQSGITLSDAMAHHEHVFGELFVNMVRVGETAGNLDEVLKIVAVQIEKEHELKSKVRGAMIYPGVILTVMFCIGIIMLTYVLPKLMSVFKDMNATLPPTTQVIVNISDFLRAHGILVAFLFIGVLFGVNYFVKTGSGKKTVSYLSLHAPVFGPIVRQVNCARFARIYSSLLRSGVSVIDALKIIAHTLGNYYYQQALLNGIDEVQKGINLSKVLSNHGDIFPILVSQIVQVGEETGKTEVVLLQLAEFYEDEVDQVTKNMSSIIEPLLMVIIGIAVGFFAVAMLQPMYSLMDNIK